MEKDDMSLSERRNETGAEQVQDLERNITKPEKWKMFFLKVKILLFYDLGAVDGAPEIFRTFPISFLHSLLRRAIFHV